MVNHSKARLLLLHYFLPNKLSVVSYKIVIKTYDSANFGLTAWLFNWSHSLASRTSKK